MLYLRDMSSGDVRALPGTEDAVHPFFSPDGLWIGFLTVDHVKKVARQGGAVISLCEAVNPVLAWWRHPSRIYFTEHETYILSRVAADGGKPEQLLTTDAAGVTRFSDVLPDEQTVFAERAAASLATTRTSFSSTQTARRNRWCDPDTRPNTAPDMSCSRGLAA
jgi:hypothetical protein